jgi:phosphate transporter
LNKCVLSFTALLMRRRIYQLEKNLHRTQQGGEDAESSPLIPADNPDQVFQRALDVELEKVVSFYQIKEGEIYYEVGELLRDKEGFEAENQAQVDGQEAPRPDTSSRPRQGSIFRSFTRHRRPSLVSQLLGGVEDSDEDEDAETSALNKQRPPPVERSRTLSHEISFGTDGTEDMRASTELTKSIRRHSQAYEDYANEAFSALYSYGITLKKRAISLYVQLCELKSFAQLNRTGFSKVLKKYDKICERDLQSRYIERYVTPAYPFQSTTMKHIDENIQRMEQAYAAVVTQGDVAEAKKELRLHLREHVVWERNTVWREMIGIERKAQAANMGLRRTLLGPDTDLGKARLQGDDEAITDMKELRTPVGRITCPAWLLSPTLFTLIFIIAVFFVLLYIPIFNKVEEQNCLAMLVFVSLLWATEVRELTT